MISSFLSISKPLYILEDASVKDPPKPNNVCRSMLLLILTIELSFLFGSVNFSILTG